jgi:hypothetical protein
MNRRGAGATEYIIILALVLAILLFTLWKFLGPALINKLDEAGFEVPGRRAQTPIETTKEPGAKAPETSGATSPGSSNWFNEPTQWQGYRSGGGSSPGASTETVNVR